MKNTLFTCILTGILSISISSLAFGGVNDPTPSKPKPTGKSFSKEKILPPVKPLQSTLSKERTGKLTAEDLKVKKPTKTFQKERSIK